MPAPADPRRKVGGCVAVELHKRPRIGADEAEKIVGEVATDFAQYLPGAHVIRPRLHEELNGETFLRIPCDQGNRLLPLIISDLDVIIGTINHAFLPDQLEVAGRANTH